MLENMVIKKQLKQFQGSKLAYLSYCISGKLVGKAFGALSVHFKLIVLRRFFEVGTIASSESLSQEPLLLPVCWNSHSARSWFLVILAGVKLSSQACNQGGKAPRKMCSTYFKNIGHSLQNVSPSENSSPPWCPKLVTGLCLVNRIFVCQHMNFW